MYFEPLIIQNKPLVLATIVYIKNYILSKHNPRLREAIYTNIEHLIGENALANDNNFIDLDQLTIDANEFQLIELYQLADYIREFKI